MKRDPKKNAPLAVKFDGPYVVVADYTGRKPRWSWRPIHQQRRLGT